jgi:CDP-6-deoxy-D-xylo-4-hexulose-3-dehydrase
MNDLKKMRKQILELVAQYTRMEQTEAKPYTPGSRIPYASRVFDEDERVNLVDSALTFWLTAGEYGVQFEKALGEYLGVPYAYAVNSGSSANLLAFMALTSPLLENRALKRGDEVISVALAFPTTVAPIVQTGCVPVFVDVAVPSYNIDISKLNNALSSKTKAVFLAHSIGNTFNLKAVSEFCKKNGLFLIEDNCDALGAEYDRGYGYEKSGTIGDIGTSSFYPAHHITMGEGGAVYTKDPLLARIMLSMRDWGRDCVCPPGKDDTCGHRFDGQYGTLPVGYDHKYVYSHLGYNLKITDMQAALGVAQLDKLPGFVARRRENWQSLKEGLQTLSKWLILPEEEPNSRISPFGFVVTVKEGSPIPAGKLAVALESGGVQTRRIFAGNITRQPCFAHLKEGVDYKISGGLEVTDRIMKDTLFVGVYPGLDNNRIQTMIKTFKAAFES